MNIEAAVQIPCGEKHVERNDQPHRAMAPIITDSDKVFDVFQPGLKRGVERLPYAPTKKYFYVEHPTEGWRVYLRAACFLHELYRPFQPSRFLIVKRTDGDPAKATWEPPKGQMEGRDGRDPSKSIIQLLKENIRREVAEEAKISSVRELTHTGLVLQSIEPDFPPNTHFQYHIFSGYAHPTYIQKAFSEFDWIKEHPEEFKQLRSDQREKDAIDWYDKDKKMMGKWSPTIVNMYLAYFKP
jgi:ADP-ribose pyrophosphatase YjhB (NUDIX family)